jgi:hypothetical protein
MVNPERAAEWDWVPIPRIRKAPAMCPTKDTPNNNCYEFAECRGLIV